MIRPALGFFLGMLAGCASTPTPLASEPPPPATAKVQEEPQSVQIDVAPTGSSTRYSHSKVSMKLVELPEPVRETIYSHKRLRMDYVPWTPKNPQPRR